MTAHFSTLAGRTELLQLRCRIIDTYLRAQSILERAGSAPPSRTHTLMLAYNKLYEDMRADIAKASDSFPNADAMLAWLLADGQSHPRGRSHGSESRCPSPHGGNRKSAKGALRRCRRLAGHDSTTRLRAMKAAERQRPMRCRIIRQWTVLPRDKRQTVKAGCRLVPPECCG